MIVWNCPKCKRTARLRSGVKHHCVCGMIDESPQGILAPPREVSPVTRREATRTCTHRGDDFRLQWCSPCRGSIKVFPCNIHGECTLGKQLPDIACCKNCPDKCEPGAEPTVTRTTGFANANTRQPGKVQVGFLAVVYDGVGGTETWHRAIVPSLPSRNIAVAGFVTTWKQRGDIAGLGCPVAHGIAHARELARNVDVLVEWGVHQLADVLPATNRPQIISVNHGDLASDWNMSMIRERMGVADAIVSVHPDVASHLLQQGANSIYIPNAVTRHQLPPRSMRNAHKRVLWLHRFAPEKRPMFVIDIARRLPDVQFRLVGAGPAERELRRAVATVANVTVADPVTSAWPELANADVFLSTSASEGFGYSVAEAMAAGVPVVASPYGIASDSALCDHVASDASADEWARALTVTLAHPTRKTLAAQRYIRRCHDPNTIIERWRHLVLSRAQQRRSVRRAR